MYQCVKYNEYLEQVLEQLPKGVFLTVKSKNELNTMIIGWAQFGYIWGKKVLITYVRYSRHTFSLLKETNEFTVSIPLKKDLSKQINYCGSNSGKKVNKFTECGLKTIKGRKIDTPIISDCELHYECKIIYKQSMEHALINENVKDKYYQNNDFHVMYYGEIVDCYLYSDINE